MKCKGASEERKGVFDQCKRGQARVLRTSEVVPGKCEGAHGVTLRGLKGMQGVSGAR